MENSSGVGGGGGGGGTANWPHNTGTQLIQVAVSTG